MRNVLTEASNALKGRRLLSRSILSGDALYNMVRKLDDSVKISGDAYRARISKPIWDFRKWEIDKSFESVSPSEIVPYIEKKFCYGFMFGSHLIFSDSKTNFHEIKVLKPRYIENKNFCPHKIELSYTTKPI